MTEQASPFTRQPNSITKVERGNYQVHTEIEIDAPASVVWETLTDFDNYDWSSSFKGLDKPVAAGAQITATFRMMGRTQEIEHELINVEPGAQWMWSDTFMMGMADEHLYRVESLDEERSRFVQRDRVHGGAAPILGRMFARNFHKMYLEFNAELKAEVERRHTNSG